MNNTTKLIKGDDNREYRRISRWLKVMYTQVTEKHSLFQFADMGTLQDGKADLTYFRYKSEYFALGQFMLLTAPIFYEDKDGKIGFLSGYDSTSMFRPYFIEVSECMDAVRLYVEEDAS